MIQFVAESETQANSFGQAVVDWVGRFEARYSRFRDDSLISRINAAAGREWVEIDEEMELLLQLCDQLYMTTSGIFDPTALPLIRLWFGASERRYRRYHQMRRWPEMPGWAGFGSRRRREGSGCPTRGWPLILGASARSMPLIRPRVSRRRTGSKPAGRLRT